jgi:uncharacterized membrane protein
MLITIAGHTVFAATLVALGVLGLITGDFSVIWEPVSKSVPLRAALAYLCAFTCVACGAGLLWPRTATVAARVLLVYLVVWLLVFRLPGFFHGVTVDVYWAAARTAAIVAAAWILSTNRSGGRRMARALYGVALIPFGIAHFQYVQNTAPLVPAWLPAHVAWAYLTGAAFIAAGLAILVDVQARLAAILSAWEMGLFLLLVWIPIVAKGSANAFQWGETVVTWVLTTAGWVVADSYRQSLRGSR